MTEFTQIDALKGEIKALKRTIDEMQEKYCQEIAGLKEALKLCNHQREDLRWRLNQNRDTPTGSENRRW